MKPSKNGKACTNLTDTKYGCKFGFRDRSRSRQIVVKPSRNGKACANLTETKYGCKFGHGVGR